MKFLTALTLLLLGLTLALANTTNTAVSGVVGSSSAITNVTKTITITKTASAGLSNVLSSATRMRVPQTLMCLLTIKLSAIRRLSPP
jgi:hypothetical protein